MTSWAYLTIVDNSRISLGTFDLMQIKEVFNISYQ